jgi:RNA-directed DNA polymerase
MLQARVADGSLLRLIGKCQRVGVLDGANYSEPEVGTAQGSVLSPLLGNFCLHHVLDRWFEREVKPRLRGKTTLGRYCDDFVIGFERQDDAQRVMGVLGKRMDCRRLVPTHPPGLLDNRSSPSRPARPTIRSGRCFGDCPEKVAAGYCGAE